MKHREVKPVLMLLRALRQYGVRELINRYRRAKVIYIIRDTLWLFGYDVSNLTDQEIEQGVAKFCQYLGNIGVSLVDAAEALTPKE